MMNETNPQFQTMTQHDKHTVLEHVLKALASKFYKPDLLGTAWQEAVTKYRPDIEAAATSDAFEQAMMALLHTLNTSHLGFFHGSARRASSRAALSATYLTEETTQGTRWVFQDVHEGGSAANSGIEPGQILLRVNGKEIVPPEHPVFPMDSLSEMVVVQKDGTERIVSVKVARPKGKKLHFVEPTLVQAKELSAGVGYLKVAMFPGMIGVEVANEMTQAVARLGNVNRLIVDLRGNTGGGAGCLRLMSLMTPQKTPVGFSPGKRWAQRDLDSAKLSFPRLDKIPSSTNTLWLLGLRFLPSLVRKTPIVLETEGLGSKPYDGNIVLLVNRHTASAAEMVTVFARENKLAVIVGEKTAGRLLSATSVKVGHGFRLALPVGTYITWSGAALEGHPIEPDVLVPFSWEQRRDGFDGQFEKALELSANAGLSSQMVASGSPTI